MPMIYDIRSTERAQRTLSSLTGVPIPIWERYLGHEREYTYTDDLVADVIDTHGHLPDSYQNFEFIYFHVTTSANECQVVCNKHVYQLSGITHSGGDGEQQNAGDGKGDAHPKQPGSRLSEPGLGPVHDDSHDDVADAVKHAGYQHDRTYRQGADARVVRVVKHGFPGPEGS